MYDKEYINKLEKEYFYSIKRYNILELEEIFPEIKEVIKRNIEENIIKLKVCWENIKSSVEHYLKEPKIKPFALAIIEDIYSDIRNLERILKRLDYQYNVLERKVDSKEIDVEGLKNSLDLKEIVERYGIKLQKKGHNYFTRCPFHNEKTPSFCVSDRFFYCFGCQKSGDIFTFVQEIENCSFKEALNRLKI